MKDWPWYGHVILVVIIFGFLYLFHFKPKSEEINQLTMERVSVEQELMRLRSKKKQLDKIRDELKALTFTLEKLEAIIPEREEISAILRNIQQLALDTRLNISKFIPDEMINKGFYSEKPIHIEMTGNYHSLAIFYDRLSNFSRLFNVENFTIKALQNQTETSTITVNTTAKTYIFHNTPAEKRNISEATR